jgi:PAS domain S-box-containing protein
MLNYKAAYAGFLMVVALFLANAGISYWNTRRVVADEQWVLRARQVIETLDELRATASEAEASQRGFVITGGATYLDTYETAAGEIRNQLDELYQLTADNPPQQQRIEALKTPVERRLDRLQENLDIRRDQGFEAARDIVAAEEGRLLMSDVKDRVNELKDTEKSVLATRVADARASLRTKLVTNVIGTLLGIAVTVFALLLFRRTLLQRQRSEDEARTEASHQAVLAELRRLALSDADAGTVMKRASELAATTLDVPLAGIFEPSERSAGLRLRTGVGWRAGSVGLASIGAGEQSMAGFALGAGDAPRSDDTAPYPPVICQDVNADPRFAASPLLSKHGAVSGVCAVICDGTEAPWGVLGVFATSDRAFTPEDTGFLRSIANVLASMLQRRKSEQALRDSEARFRALAESVPEIVWTAQPDGRCDYVNRRWQDFTGMSFEAAAGFGWTNALHEDDVQYSKARWMASMRSGDPFECEYRFRRADGSYRWCLGRALPMRDEQGRIVKWFGNCTDIDNHLRMEKALQATDRRKNEFLAVLAHELRNPLAPIGVVAQLLKLPDHRPEQIKQAAKIIDDQLDYMTRLIEDLSDASRIGQGKVRIRKERVQVSQIVEQAVAIAEPAIAARDHGLRVDLPEQALTVDADPTRMSQVLANLLINASKYTDRGGQIELCASGDEDTVTMRVKDTGVGISPDLLDTVFDDFFQVEDSVAHSQGGLGIGLGLVRRLVELHGGTVQARSDGPGCGSEFVVTLPAPRAARPVGFHRVLLAEDHSAVAQSFARLLTARGSQVEIARTGPEALALARRLRPDLIFLDIGLPDMDGFEVARRLREDAAFEHTVLVALSGYGDERRAQALESGFDRYVVKPLRPDMLDDILAEPDSGERAPADAASEQAAAAERSAPANAAL